MAQSNKTFRIFVSSTFTDLEKERNALQKYVFPRLRDLCMQHGCRFQAIDLRWGVSEEAGRDQQTMKICLEEIARCQKTTIRPNFIVLLGDRYGWCPLPTEIPEDEFDQIIKKVTDQGEKEKIDQWYKCDENAVPPVYCLKEREVKSPEGATDDQKIAAQDKESQEWRKTEKNLRLILIKAIDKLGWEKDDPKKVIYEASATEQEINKGALNHDDAKKHVFCFFRNINGETQYSNAQDFFDIDDKGKPDNIARSKLEHLKIRLSEALPGNVSRYNANWTDNGLSKDHIGNLEKLEDSLKEKDAGLLPPGLCKDIWNKLSKVINEEIAQFENDDALKNEIKNHKDFGKKRAKFFVGRDSILKQISDHVKGTDTHPLAVFGVSGSGKSALMACAVKIIRRENKNVEVISRYIGATPESSDGRALLESLCRQISRRYGADESTIPNDYKKLVEEFPKRLSLATSEKPLFIFLDALDQLSNTDNANNLFWIPRELPPNVHLVVSTLNGEEKKLPSAIRIELEKMLLKDGNELLGLLLEDAKRSLQKDQKNEVLNKFEKSGLPLYLKLAFEEARRWKSYDGIPPGSNGKQGLSEEVPGIIRDMFSRLSSESNHGKMLVSRSMGYLAASKNGLTEDEMLDVLSEDDELYQDFLRRARHIPSEKKLPVVVWSRLYFDLEPYLTQRSADGTSLMAFFHRQFGEVVVKLYLDGDDKLHTHRKLAEYFHTKDYWCESLEDQRKRANTLPPTPRTANVRKVNELPCQRLYAQQWDELESLLTDLSFIEAKTEAGMVFDLADDFKQIMKMLPVERPARRILHLLEEAIHRDIHFIAHHPTTFFQCMWNTCWWYDCPEATKHYDLPKADWVPEGALWKHPGPKLYNLLDLWRTAKESTTPGFRWLKSLRPPPEPLGAALRGVIRVHERSVSCVAVSPDGHWILSTSEDGTIRFCDAENGRELRCLHSHTGDVVDAALSSDGRWLVSIGGYSDRTMRVWNCDEGRILHSVHDPSYWFHCVATYPDNCRIVTGGGRSNSESRLVPYWDQRVYGTIRVWNAETGDEILSLNGHTGFVNSVAVSSDGRWIVSGSDDTTVRVWDANIGTQLACIEPKAGAIKSVAVSPNHQLLAIGGMNDVEIWDTKTFTIYKHLMGHDGWIYDIEFSFDGERIVSGGLDGTIRVWDIHTGHELFCFRGHGDVVSSVAFFPDGQRVVSGSGDSTLRIWELLCDQKVKYPQNQRHGLIRIEFSPDAKCIATGYGDGDVRLWDALSGCTFNCLKGNRGSPGSIVFSRDSQILAIGSSGGSVRLFDVRTGTQLALFRLRGHQSWVYRLAFSFDSQRIAAGYENGTILVWSAQRTGHPIRLNGHSGWISGLAFSSDGQRIVSGGKDSRLRVWDATSGVELACFCYGEQVDIDRVGFSPDGRRIISETRYGTVNIWDVETGKSLRSIERGHDAFDAVIGVYSRWRAASDNSDVVLEEIQSKTTVAWLPAPPHSISSHPLGRTWAGSYKNHLYLFSFEGVYKRSNTDTSIQESEEYTANDSGKDELKEN